MRNSVRLFTKHAQLGRRCLSSIREPLNILFFGSDQFSIHSLRAIDELRRNGTEVETLQLVTRSPKWCGRKNSTLRLPPITEAAEELGLASPLLCDTREDFVKLRQVVEKERFNMIIAVSFGKLIPGKLINDVAYALNVHPSLLPRYKGASPIQYTLLNHDQETGVTVQTLHPSKFDHGSIVARTRPLQVDQLLQKGTVSKFDEDVPSRTAILMDQLGVEGSSLLKKVITSGTYKNKEGIKEIDSEPSYAPKITTEMRRINWESDSATQLLDKLQILGPIFTYKKVSTKNGTADKRIIFHELEIAPQQEIMLEKPGEFIFNDQKKSLCVKCKENYLKVKKVQFEGFKVEDVKQFITSFRKRCGPEMAQQKIFL